MSTKNKQSVTVKDETVNLPEAHDYSAYAGQGFGSHTKDDYAVPFLGVLQALSPLLEQVAEAKAGMLFNTVTRQLYDGKKGIVFIPVDTKHSVLEWKPNRGGFVADHPMDSEIVAKARAEQEFGKWKSIKGDPNSNDLTETFTVFGIFVDEHSSPEQMTISFSSTKIKKYTHWMTKARTIQAPKPGGGRQNLPLFAHKYRITSVSDKNAKGTFYNLNIEFDGKDAESCRLPVNDPLFQTAVGFFDLLKGGQVKAAYDSQTGNASADAAAEAAEVPFK